MDFQIVPLSQDSLEWQCSLLKIGGLKVLLNCGWTEALDPKLLEPVVQHLPGLDLVLLTHADLRHLGGVPYLLAKHAVSCPVVCTEPICRLGELACVAVLEDREKYQQAAAALDVDDVLRVFMSRVTQLNYRETYHVQKEGRSLAVCPYPAGGHLGSAYWTLSCGGVNAVYLVDGTLRRSRFLDGLDVHRLLPNCRGTSQSWDVLITSPLPSMGALLPQRGVRQSPQEVTLASKAMAVARSVREQALLEGTISALRRGGTVLIPADVTGWIPEVLLLFEAAWSQDRQLAGNYPLVWLSSMGDMVLDQVKTRLEYMSQEVLKNFEQRFGHNPFVLRNVRIFQTLEDLCGAHALSRPKVIFCTSPHLDGGDSRELFTRLCAEPRNLTWLLGTPPAGSFGRQLFDDFVVRHAAKKEYRLSHYLKEGLPEEQLRDYYEAKIQEMADKGDMVPPELRPLKSEGTRLKLEEEEDADADAALGVKTEGPPGAQARAAVGALYCPPGWPASRTHTYNEVRTESDEYGHLLAAGDVRAWKAQDQGADQAAAEGPAEDAEAVAARAVKHEEAAMAKMEDNKARLADFRDSVMAHFPEPVHYEVRERLIRVACHVKFVPDSTPEPNDFALLVEQLAPRHVVMLPGAPEFTSGQLLSKRLAHSSLGGGSEVHLLSPGGPPLELTLRSRKRKVLFAPDVWPKMRFVTMADGTRVARTRAAPSAAREDSDLRVLELGAPLALENGGVADSAAAKLPRGGALFLNTGEEPLTLSGLKEKLSRAEWTRDDVPVDFQAPKAPSQRLKGGRVLTVDGKAALGWLSAKGRAGAGGGEAPSAPTLRLEGLPGEAFFMARASLYKACALV